MRLFRAARSERVNLRQVYRAPQEDRGDFNPSLPGEDAEPPARQAASAQPSRPSTPPPDDFVLPVRRVAAAGTREEIIPETDILKGYEFEKGSYVTLSRDELKQLEPKTATEMEIQELVHLDKVDPLYFETSYYVKPDPGGEKPYALLYESLRRTGLAAVGRFAMHRREHITILRPAQRGLMAHTMFFTSEVRADQECAADASLLSPKELALADSLVQALAADFEPAKYHDTYKEKLEELIATKVSGREVSVTAAAPTPAPVVDIMDALKKSLAQVRKPPVRSAASNEARARAKRSTTRKAG